MATLNLAEPTKDTTLDEAAASPQGGSATFSVGRRYIDVGFPEFGTAIMNSLMQFDLSALPSNAIVSSAVLTLRCTSSSSTGPEFVFLGIDPAKAWVEAEADWDEYSSGNFWDFLGGDYDPEIFNVVANLPTSNGDVNFTVTTIVQSQFMDQDLSTVGLFMYYTLGTLDSATFTSREGAIPARRPRLSITYTVPSPTGDLHFQGRVSQGMTGRLLG